MQEKKIGYLKQTFYSLMLRAKGDNFLANKYWNEIETCYSSKGRYYHNLHHLQNLLAYLEETKDLLENWDIILFSLFYHDIIYSPTHSDNEEQSAGLAVKRLREIQFPENNCQKVAQQILATKSHQKTGDNDYDFFTDADLAILGAEPAEYKIYAQQIRKEYEAYPETLYNEGRAKVLQHFLQKHTIYNTLYFQERFEKKARINLANELLKLN